MRQYADLTKDELKNLLNRCWMTHDAMWFYYSMQNVGIEKTNIINKAAVRNMARIEAGRIKKILNYDTIKTFDDIRIVIDTMYEILKGDFMKFTYSFHGNNTLRCEFLQCFAHEGIKSIGAIDKYECGIFERICGWFDFFGIPYKMEPEIKGCLMHKFGKCCVDFTFDVK